MIILCVLFYLAVTVFGFRNVWQVLWKQKKYKFAPLTLLYLCAQSVCILRIAQYLALLTADIRSNKGDFC